MTALEQQKIKDEQFEHLLEQLETEVSTTSAEPECDGAWSTRIQALLDRLYGQFSERARKVHSGEFAQITSEDPGLVPRVDALCEEDRSLERDLLAVRDRLHEELPEGSTARQTFIDEVMSLIMRMRQQEVAVRNWLMEAFTRDRGTVD